ncbi:Hypothetical protein A7982_07888 [Minicystis rosea]|nr:Hypothetical protein A7982_07888 [Minicystis rosea]
MALGEQLLTVAKPHKKELSKGIAKAHGTLAQTHVSLKETLRDQVGLAGAPGSADNAATTLADRRIDACWSALHDFLTAFGKLPDVPAAEEALAIKATIFPDGLKFILLTYELEWAESEARLQRIKAQGLDKRIEKLGGRIFLDALTDAHAAYGKVLGMTQVQPEGAATPPSVREALNAFTDALRKYVAKVMGSVEDDEPETQALADALLAPLASWDVRGSGSASGAKAPAGGTTSAGGATEAKPAQPSGGQPS